MLLALIYAALAYHFPRSSVFPNPIPEQKTTQGNGTQLTNKPQEINIHQIPPTVDNKKPLHQPNQGKEQKKQLLQTIVQNMKDSPGSVQVGVNNAPLTINPVPPPKPFDERLRDLLNEINPDILRALNKGIYRFKVTVPQNQHIKLLDLLSEKDSSVYIHKEPGDPTDTAMAITDSGWVFGISFSLTPEFASQVNTLSNQSFQRGTR